MWYQPRTRGWWLLALAGFLTTARAADDLALDQAVAQALAHSAVVRAADQAVARARAEAVSAGILPAARLQATPLYSDERGLDIEAVVSLPLYDATLRPAQRVARAALAAALCDADEAQLDLVATTSATWHRLLAAQRQAEAVANDLALAQVLRAAAAKARDIGERPGVDVLRADLELGLTEQAQADAEAAVELASGELARLTGRDLATPVRATAEAQPWPKLVRAALLARADERPRVKAARLRVDEARALVGLAKAGRSTGVAVEGFREDREHGLRVAVELPLFDRGRQAGEIRAAEARLAEAEQQLEAARQAAAMSVDTAWLAAESAERRLLRHQEAVLARAQRLTELTTQAYGAGELSLLDVLDARRRLAEARVTSVALEAAASEALTQLQAAVGADLRATDTLVTPTALTLPTGAP